MLEGFSGLSEDLLFFVLGMLELSQFLISLSLALQFILLTLLCHRKNSLLLSLLHLLATHFYLIVLVSKGLFIFKPEFLSSLLLLPLLDFNLQKPFFLLDRIKSSSFSVSLFSLSPTLGYHRCFTLLNSISLSFLLGSFQLLSLFISQLFLSSVKLALSFLVGLALVLI